MSHYCRESICIKTIPDDRDYCPEHELRYDNPPGGHFHQYVTPVAWEYTRDINGRITHKVVTQLACECGDTILKHSRRSNA